VFLGDAGDQSDALRETASDTEKVRDPLEQLKTFQKLLPGSQGHNLVFTVLYVPYSLESGGGATCLLLLCYSQA
jgi:hypothetical protein